MWWELSTDVVSMMSQGKAWHRVGLELQLGLSRQCCGKLSANHPLEPAPAINLDLQMSMPAGTGLPLAGLE